MLRVNKNLYLLIFQINLFVNKYLNCSHWGAIAPRSWKTRLDLGIIVSFTAVRKQLDDCLQDYSVKTRNARNSLPINGYPRSTVITERRGSRDERQIMERRRSRDDRARESDENGNAKRKLSTGEKIDLDFLRIIANRSGQTSPSNVCFEENEQEADETERIDQTLELNDGIVKNKPFEDNEESRSDESNKNEDVSITDNADNEP